MNNITGLHHTLWSALKLMDEIGRKVLFIVDDDHRFIGVISLGDIQRALIRNVDINSPIQNILRHQITVAYVWQDIDEIKKNMLLHRIEAMPIIDELGYLKNVVYWEDLFDQQKPLKQLNLPVVIMAGGRGTRMQPFTNILPKPLLPFGNHTFLEEIMHSFRKYGCTHFYITLNYRSEIIKFYVEHYVEKSFSIQYIEEPEPLGTAGGLSILKSELHNTFFFTNCDILIQDDYSEILSYHIDKSNDLTIVAALKSIHIPYGTIETNEDGFLKSIHEKPELTFKINTGLYVMEPHVLADIPSHPYDMTDLINALMKKKCKIGVFPVSERSWIDIGQWEQYEKYIKK